MDEILITLPLPDRRLSPNARVHWRTLWAQKKAYKRAAYVATYYAGGQKAKWMRATAKVTFFWKDRRDRDMDNAMASLKSAWDGIKEAGLIEDDCARVLTHEPAEFRVDGDDPRVEIRVRKL